MKDDAITECLCGKKGTVERMITGTAGIIFKGTGFYVTDYKKDGAKSESSSLPPAATPAPTQSTTESKTNTSSSSNES